MNVDIAEAPFKPDPSRTLDKLEVHCACFYVRMCYSHLPISPDDLLMSLYKSNNFTALEFIDVEHSGDISAVEGRAVIPVIAAVMKSEPYRCRLISMSSVSVTALGDVINGMRLRRDGRAKR